MSNLELLLILSSYSHTCTVTLTSEHTPPHKVHTYKEYHSVCPLDGIGTLPPPLSPVNVPLPPEPKGVGDTLRAGEGLGESQFQRLEKKLITSAFLCPTPFSSFHQSDELIIWGFFSRTTSLLRVLFHIILNILFEG
jgi:hypothetical protein